MFKRFKAAASIFGGPKSFTARAGAFVDGRRTVRLAFLSGAAHNGVFEHLPGTTAEVLAAMGGVRADRLEAWLRVGVELGELSVSEPGPQWDVVGRRAKALAKGDAVVEPFYRSVAEYYFGPHFELNKLVAGHPGRDDLSASAETIADVSKVTEVFLTPTIQNVISELQPSTWLEVGCGSGGHLRTALQNGTDVKAVAVDLDPAVIDRTKTMLTNLGFSDRVDLRTGDVLHVVDPSERFGVVTLFNNIYYFVEDSRASVIDRLASMVKPGGELVLASQCLGGSIASAQLDFILRSQRNRSASLPTEVSLTAAVESCSNVAKVDVHHPVFGEPYVVIRATVR